MDERWLVRPSGEMCSACLVVWEIVEAERSA